MTELLGPLTPAQRLGGTIQLTPRSIELVCLHEAGHACAYFQINKQPALIEIIDGPLLHGRTRGQALQGDQRKYVATAGHAVERWLYDSKRLVNDQAVAVTERQFLDFSLGEYASEDKEKYYKRKPPSGGWTAKQDMEFGTSAFHQIKYLDFVLIEKIAERLMYKLRLDGSELDALAKA